MNKFLTLLIIIILTGCTSKVKPIETIEDAHEKIEIIEKSQQHFELNIADSLQDSMGMNMTIILDKLLSKNFEPNGFEQKSGYRVYKYKKSEL